MFANHHHRHSGPLAKDQEVKGSLKNAKKFLSHEEEINKFLDQYREKSQKNEKKLQKHLMKLDLLNNPDKIDAMLGKISAEEGPLKNIHAEEREELERLKGYENNSEAKRKAIKRLNKEIRQIKKDEEQYNSYVALSDAVIEVKLALDSGSEKVSQNYLNDLNKLVNQGNMAFAGKEADKTIEALKKIDIESVTKKVGVNVDYKQTSRNLG
jgi:hypothetical protein